MIAGALGWTLLDRALVDAVARVAKVDRETAVQYDERVDSWWRRVYRGGVWAAAVEGGMSVADAASFDGERVAALTEQTIIGAVNAGKCVIVGRGAQCVLQDREDIFHVFLYGPEWERVAAVRARTRSRAGADELVRAADEKRARYVRTYYGCDWRDPHLYHMMLSCRIGVASAAWMVLDAVERGEGAGSAIAEPRQFRDADDGYRIA
jgi:cytidylate kinase